jgi:hypothetical protein
MFKATEKLYFFACIVVHKCINVMRVGPKPGKGGIFGEIVMAVWVRWVLSLGKMS